MQDVQIFELVFVCVCGIMERSRVYNRVPLYHIIPHYTTSYHIVTVTFVYVVNAHRSVTYLLTNVEVTIFYNTMHFYFFQRSNFFSVLRGHSVFSSPPQRPMTSNIQGFLYQIVSITLFSYLNSSERANISHFNVER